MSSSTVFQLTGFQKFFFAILRMAIGWHFLREGYVKLSQTHWSSMGYLKGSWGPFGPFFNNLADDQTKYLTFLGDGGYTFLQINDVMIPWALTLAGIGLLFGIFTRLSSLIAIGLLAVFYISAPPWGEPTIPPLADGFTWQYYQLMMSNATWAGNQMIGAEGNYQIINKNLIELFAVLALLTTNSGSYCGFDGYLKTYIFSRRKKVTAKAPETTTTPELTPATE